jgi:hypothetical protein
MTYLVHQYLVPCPKYETRRIQLALDSPDFGLKLENVIHCDSEYVIRL